MIAAWMIFATEVGALLYCAAWLAERVLKSARGPVRGVWLAALAGTNLVPLAAMLLPSHSGLTSRWALPVGHESILGRVETPLLVAWSVAVAIGVFVCLAAVRRMSRARPLWKTEHMDNAPVLVSHDIGPALVGVLQYSIVVPQWTYQLESQARALLVTHEREHARKYDPLLLTIAIVAVVLAPWNVFNWLLMKRLHLAIELDCDQRVLRAHPDARGYGTLLLDVAERVLPSVLPTAAFAEYGASLETRINAIGSTTTTFHGVRVASGLTLSLLLVAAACFTPRPYAIYIVNPPAAPQQAAQIATPGTQSAASTPVVQAMPADLGAAIVPMPPVARPGSHTISTSSEVSEQTSRSDREIRPVAPSARTLQLEAAEAMRIRNVVAKSAPRTLGRWPREDSALVMLLDKGGNVLKTMSTPRLSIREGTDPLYVVSRLLTIPDDNGIDNGSEVMIDRGASGELLQAPLKLYTATVLDNLPVPKTREEVTPRREAMLALVRARHPEALADTLDDTKVSVLLYDTRGQLLKSAVVNMDSDVRLADLSRGNKYEREVWRKAFGSAVDSSTVMESGVESFIESGPIHTGPAKIMYVMMLKKSDSEAFQKGIGAQHRNWTFGGISTRPGSRGSVNYELMTARVRTMVHTRVPDAYGDWARGDSAVILLFDAFDNLIARRAGPIPASTGMQGSADYISLRVPTVSSEDIDQAGWTNHVTSETGRVLDKPLVVVWGRLTAEATRRRKLSEMK